eukprot:GHVS01085223.1.p1 GENE.GHVS01085223.1~~GHVS01085223.1.p1  ORF type:complete len:524 (-),score=89.04 GHVS01085223.1:67-1638(-)
MCPPSCRSLHPLPLWLLLCNVLLLVRSVLSSHTFTSDWKSLDARPLPAWYSNAKLGLFVHWGVYSVPGYSSTLAEWFWHQWKTEHNSDVLRFLQENYPPNHTYQDFGPQFTAELFNATDWASLFAKSGAKYVVVTGKHHDGFRMWPSPTSFGWNAMDVGPRRDVIGDLAEAIRSQGGKGEEEGGAMEFGIYHSLLEWYDPLFLKDKANRFQTRHFPMEKVLPDLKDLVEKYKPSIIWSDGNWEGSDVYWGSLDFLRYLYNESPVKDNVVVNDRWGNSTDCRHGGVMNCSDRYNPRTLQARYWENCQSIDRKSWGVRRNAKLSDFLDLSEIIEQLLSSVAFGGNLLLNIGPNKDGTIPWIFRERLEQLGSWMEVNGKGIFGTKAWALVQKEANQRIYYTCVASTGAGGGDDGVGDPSSSFTCLEGEEDLIYVLFMDWPQSNVLLLSDFPARYVHHIVHVVLVEGHASRPVPIEATDEGGVAVKLKQLGPSANQPAWSLRMKFHSKGGGGGGGRSSTYYGEVARG